MIRSASWISAVLLCLSALFLADVTTASGQTLARGTVFHDANRNGTREDGETGIEAVAVSNGEQVVLTDAQGRYELPVTDDTTLFVIKPRDWMTPVDRNGLPQFYYHHKPAGSPTPMQYPGVAPTGPLPPAIDFPLFPQPDQDRFRIAVFGDTQPYNLTEVDYLAEDIVPELIGRTDLKFGITLGDIVGDNLTLFEPVNDAIGQIGLPWYYVLGNHDQNFDAAEDHHADESFERVYGPPDYAFVYGRVHFIVLDDVIHYQQDGRARYTGGFRPDQFAFIENYLRTVPRDHLVVLAMHIPIEPNDRWFRIADLQKLFGLLKDFPKTLSLSAHSHQQINQFFPRGLAGWQQDQPHHHYNVGTTCGAWWRGAIGEKSIPHAMMQDGTPNGYALISFDGVDYVVDWKVAGADPEYRMSLHLPRGWNPLAGEPLMLTVNFFNGSDQCRLEYRVVGHTQWQPLKKVSKVDPHYQLLHTLGGSGKKMSRPLASSHLWEADLGDWPPGRYSVEVRAQDLFGRTFRDTQTFRVIPGSVTLGHWKSGETSEAWQQRSWDITGKLTKAGTFDITFQYESGRCRLEMKDVRIVVNGEVVAKEAREGQTGNRDVGNRYTFTLDQLPTDAKVELQAMIRSDAGTDSNGSIQLTWTQRTRASN